MRTTGRTNDIVSRSEKYQRKRVGSTTLDKQVGAILAKEVGASFIETSAKNAKNVEESFLRMASELVKRQYALRLFMSIDG